MPAISLIGTRITIQSRLDLPADQWEVSSADPARFIEASAADRVTLRLGLLDPVTSEARFIGWIKNGVIDEYELAIEPDSQRVTLRGRDGITRLLDRHIAKRYLHFPKKTTVASTPEAEEVDEVVGQFRAQEVAADILSLIEGEPLTMAWGARDYALLTDFDATARPIDLLKRLVEPWSQTEPYKVDVYIRNDVILCRPRMVTPVADYTFNLPDVRLSNLTIAKRRLPIYGKVTLFGRLAASSLVKDPDFLLLTELEGGSRTSIGLTSSAMSTTTTTDFDDRPGEGPPAAGGKDFGTVKVTNTYRMPDKILIKQEKLTYAGLPKRLVSEELVINEWDPSQYDESGSINAPKMRSQTVTIKGYPNGDTTKPWQDIKSEISGYAYDGQNFLVSQITKKKELNQLTGVLEDKEQITKTYVDTAPQEVEETTTVLRRRKNSAGRVDWYVASREAKTAGGFRPGGPGRGKLYGKQTMGLFTDELTDDGSLQPIALRAVISTDPDAVPFEYSNENLSDTDLAFIYDQLRRASGKWAYEMRFTCPAMTWIQRGAYVHITGITTQDATPITSQPALVIDVSLTHDESTDSPSSMATITAMFWSDT